MPNVIEIRLGKADVTLTRSDRLIALRARPGKSVPFDSEVRSLEARGRGARRGRLAGFDIVELPAARTKQLSAREDVGRMMSMQRQAPVYHTSDDEVPFVPTGTIYLSFAEGVSQETANDVLSRHSLTVLKAERNRFLTVSTSSDPVELCTELQRESAVAVAEPDLATLRQPAQLTMPADPLLGELWHLRNVGEHGGHTFGYRAGADARVIDAWSLLGEFGRGDAVIGIIDDGFDLSHPDLRGKAVLPWDFVRNSPDVTPAIPENGNDDWHGTACAGVAAGSIGAGDMIGAAPNARIMPVRMGPDIDPEVLSRMFEYMALNGAWVVNCSWGPVAARYPLGQRLSDAIEFCVRKGRQGLGTPLLFAAGNSNTSINDGFHLNGFATHPLVIAVASSTSLDQRADTSNFGAEISVCAPSSGGGGWAIISSDVTGSYVDAAGVIQPRGYAPGDYVRSFGGTSSACALVSGICALVLSAAPELPADAVRAVLQSTARKVGDPAGYEPDGHSAYFGFGCVDAAAAIAAARASGQVAAADTEALA